MDKSLLKVINKLEDRMSHVYPDPVSRIGTKDFYERWKNNHISLITSEDVHDLTRIANIKKLQTLVFLLILTDSVG